MLYFPEAGVPIVSLEFYGHEFRKRRAGKNTYLSSATSNDQSASTGKTEVEFNHDCDFCQVSMPKQRGTGELNDRID